MNRTELIDAASAKAGISKKDAGAALSAIVDVISDALASGDKVALVGFGTFETRNKAARTGKNLRTGETIEIPASVAPAFKAGKALKDKVNAK